MVAKIFLFIKDEIDTIEQWIQHHASIVGTDNLFIIDNGSTDGSLEVIRKHKKINLYHSESYNKRESELNLLISSEKEGTDLLIPLDADEFISLKHEDEYIFDPEIIWVYLECNFKKWEENNNSVLSISEYLLGFPPKKQNVSLSDINLFYSQNKDSYAYFRQFSKVFFLASDFISTDGGNHSGKTVSGNNTKKQTEIVLFHLWNLSWEKLYQKEIKTCKSRGYNIEDNNELQKLVDQKARSWHKIMNILHYRNGTIEDYWADELNRSKKVYEFGRHIKKIESYLM